MGAYEMYACRCKHHTAIARWFFHDGSLGVFLFCCDNRSLEARSMQVCVFVGVSGNCIVAVKICMNMRLACHADCHEFMHSGRPHWPLQFVRCLTPLSL